MILVVRLSKPLYTYLISTRVKTNPKWVNSFWVQVLTQLEFDYERFRIQSQAGLESCPKVRGFELG